MKSRDDKQNEGYVDIHSHFLYGVDDGAQTPKAMEDLLDAAWANGVRKMIATPHVVPGLQPMMPDLIQERLSEAKKYCLQKKYDIALDSGAEILFSPMLESFIGEHPLPTLAGSSCILLEFLPNVSYETMVSAIAMATRNGYRVVLAHIERYEALFHRNNIYRLKDKCDLIYQMNCSAVIEGVGFWRNNAVKRWMRDHIIDRIASDCHDARVRPIRMNEAYLEICSCYGVDLANRLTKNKNLA